MCVSTSKQMKDNAKRKGKEVIITKGEYTSERNLKVTVPNLFANKKRRSIGEGQIRTFAISLSFGPSKETFGLIHPTLSIRPKRTDKDLHWSPLKVIQKNGIGLSSKKTRVLRNFESRRDEERFRKNFSVSTARGNTQRQEARISCLEISSDTFVFLSFHTTPLPSILFFDF